MKNDLEKNVVTLLYALMEDKVPLDELEAMVSDVLNGEAIVMDRPALKAAAEELARILERGYTK